MIATPENEQIERRRRKQKSFGQPNEPRGTDSVAFMHDKDRVGRDYTSTRAALGWSFTRM